MNRLKDRKLIDNLFNKKVSKTASLDGIRIVYYKSDVSGVMVSASSSVFKRAVDRNLIKRYLRLSVADKNLDNYVIGIIYSNKVIKDFNSIKSIVDKLLVKL